MAELGRQGADEVVEHQDDLAAGKQSVVDRLQRALRKFKVVVCVADENQIDGVLGELCRELIAEPSYPNEMF